MTNNISTHANAVNTASKRLSQIRNTAANFFGNRLYAWTAIKFEGSWSLAATVANFRGLWVVQMLSFESDAVAMEVAQTLNSDDGLYEQEAHRIVASSIGAYLVMPRRAASVDFRYVESMDAACFSTMHHGEAFKTVRPGDDFGMEISGATIEMIETQFQNLHWALTFVEVEGGFVPFAVAANRVGFLLVEQEFCTDQQSVQTFADLYNMNRDLEHSEAARILVTGMFAYGRILSHARMLWEAESYPRSE